MSHSSTGSVARIELVISSSVDFEVRRHCPRCQAERPFVSSGKFRVNAQKKLIDIWLIWRCTSCDQTWNQAIHERRTVRALPPAALQAFMQNDEGLVRHHAGMLAAQMGRGASDWSVTLRVLRPMTDTIEHLEVVISAPPGSMPRLDRVLSAGLKLGRGKIAALADSDALVIAGGGLTALRRPALGGQEVRIDLATCRAELAARLTAGAT